VKLDRYFSIRFQHEGKRREEGLGWASEGWSEQKAALELAKLKEAAKTGEGPARLEEKRRLAEAKRQAEAQAKARQAKEALTFGDFWRGSYFPLAQREKTPRSWQREDQFYRLWLAPVIGGLPLKDVSPLHLERVKKNMADAGRTPRSIHYCLAVARQVFNQARRLGLYQGEPPTSKVKPPRADNRRLRFLSQEEAAGLLEALRLSSRNLHDMALLSLHTGMRAGEVFSLTWADVDLKQGLLTLRDTKSGRTRHAYMTETVKVMLQGRPRSKPDELVFPARGGERRVQVSQAFRRVVEALGLNEGLADARQLVTFHTLRHTYASWLVMNGTPLYTVQRLLGHQTLAMTERYSHLAPDHMREAVKGLEEAMASPPAKVVPFSGLDAR
jgi:integrase